MREQRRFDVDVRVCVDATDQLNQFARRRLRHRLIVLPTRAMATDVLAFQMRKNPDMNTVQLTICALKAAARALRSCK